MTKRRILILAALALMGARADEAEESRVGVTLPSGLTVSLEPGLTQKDTGDQRMANFDHGNATLRFRVVNPTGLAQPLVAELPLTTGRGLFEPRILRVWSETEVPPDAARDWEVPLPFVAQLGHFGWRQHRGSTWFFREASGAVASSRGMALVNPVSYCGSRNSHDHWGAGFTPRVAVSAHVGTTGWSDGYSRAVMRRRYPKMSESEVERHTLPLNIERPDLARLTRWQDVSVYDALVLTEADFTALPDATRALVLDWVAAGGSLLVEDRSEGFKISDLRFQIFGEPQPNQISNLKSQISTDNPVNPVQESCLEGALSNAQTLERSNAQTLDFGLGAIVAWDGADFDRFAEAVMAATRALAQTGGAEPPLACDAAARAKVAALRGETPFGTIVLILLAFSVLAGPAILVGLARAGRRLALLWVFPSVAVGFSLAVAAALVLLKGVTPSLHQFAATLVDEAAGRAVTVQHDVILSPVPLAEPIRYPRAAMVSYDGGATSQAGAAIVVAPDAYEFRDGWTPTLWPVAFRAVTVRPLADAPSDESGFLARPLAGRLREHTVEHTVERRAAP